MSFTTLLLLSLFSIGASNGPCLKLCANPDSEAARVRCHACRCKTEFDDWLPSEQQLQCANAEPITLFKSSKADPTKLEPVTTAVSQCHNPSHFGGSCYPGSRLGQLTNGDVHFKWICRREHFTPKYSDLSIPFEKVAVIGTNTRTGATCFWENTSGTINGNNFPTLDQAKSPVHETEKFSKIFPVNEGWSCLYCHDNDPFLYTPYLQSVNWERGDWVDGPYARVLLTHPPKKTGQWHLTTPRADRCTSCHRISSGRTCKGFAQSAFGTDKDAGHESSVTDALDKIKWTGDHWETTPGPNWTLAYWMPPRLGPKTATWTKWHSRYGEAKETIQECCKEIATGVQSLACQWKEIDGYRP